MKALPENRTGVSLPVLAIIYCPALIILLLTALITVYGNVPPGFFTRDPTATLNGHPLTGIQSNLGVILWFGTASICLFCHLMLRNRQDDNTCSSFFLWSGLITLMLTLDDLFLIHEDLLHRYLGSWLWGKVLHLFYGFITIWYVTRFRKIIFQSDYLLLVLAYSFFAASIGVDFLLKHVWDTPWRIFFEDGFKLFGIVTWAGYLILTCFQATKRQLRDLE